MYVKWKTRKSKYYDSVMNYNCDAYKKEAFKEAFSNNYCYVVESYRERGKVKSRTLAYLGNSKNAEELCEKANNFLKECIGLSVIKRMKILKDIAIKVKYVQIKDNNLVC